MIDSTQDTPIQNCGTKTTLANTKRHAQIQATYAESIPALISDMEQSNTPEKPLKDFRKIPPVLLRRRKTLRPNCSLRYKRFWTNELDTLRLLRNRAKRNAGNPSQPEALTEFKYIRRVTTARSRAKKKTMKQIQEYATSEFPSSDVVYACRSQLAGIYSRL